MDLISVLIKNLVSEKSFASQSKGKVTFKISPRANKILVRNAVEKIYNVKVVNVNIINVKGKHRTFGGRAGKTSNWKKAIITLKPGQSIGGTNIEGSQV